MKMTSESRFSLSGWLVLAAALIVIVGSFGQLVYRLAQPTDGWSADFFSSDGVLADVNILGEASPLQTGDVIVAIGGRPPTVEPEGLFKFKSYLPAGWEAGRSAQYQVRRHGQLLTLAVPLYTGAWRRCWGSW